MLSTLITEFPTFLSSISMVGDNQEDTIRDLIHAERPSPPVNEPARQLFIRVLRGDFTVDGALTQSASIIDPTDRKCARDILRASRRFFEDEPVAIITPLKLMRFPLPNGMELRVSPVWCRYFPSSGRASLMALHLWRKSLSSWQLSAAAAILISSLWKDVPEYRFADIDFISVSEYNSERRLIRYDRRGLEPLDDHDLSRFLGRLCDAWTEYQRRGRRVIQLRRDRDLFG